MQANGMRSVRRCALQMIRDLQSAISALTEFHEAVSVVQWLRRIIPAGRPYQFCRGVGQDRRWFHKKDGRQHENNRSVSHFFLRNVLFDKSLNLTVVFAVDRLWLICQDLQVPAVRYLRLTLRFPKS